jgi:hypothetical protein
VGRDQQLDRKRRYGRHTFSCRAVERLTGVGAVREAFQLLAETVVLGELHASAEGRGWCIPDQQLQCRLYNNNNTKTRPATAGCALQ